MSERAEARVGEKREMVEREQGIRRLLMFKLKAGL